MSEPRASQSYDEITRRTVVEPDGSLRAAAPSQPALDSGLRARVADALISVGYLDIGFEIEDRRVLLRGQVRDAAVRSRIEQLVAAVDGVDAVDNRIRLR